MRRKPGALPPGWPDTDGGPALILVRHGETEWSRLGRHTGRADIALTDVGERQAVSAGNLVRAVLAGAEPVLVISSPRQRARRTAELAGFAPGLVTEDAAEWDYGDLEGLTSPQIAESQPGWTIWSGQVPGGEDAAAVTARMDRLLATAAIAAETAVGDGGTAPVGPVVVFSHGHAGRCMVARWLGEPVTSGRHFKLGTGAVSSLGFEHDDPVILHWNLDSTTAGGSP